MGNYQIVEKNPGEFHLVMTTNGGGAGNLVIEGNVTTQGHELSGVPALIGTAAVAATNANASVSGTVSSLVGNDQSGRIFWVASATASISPHFQVIYATPYASAPSVMVTPATPSASALGMYISSSVNSFTVSATAPGVASASYSAYYLVTG